MASEPIVHVIDDDAAVRDSLAFLFDCAGLAVSTYESAETFLASLPAAGPGCIVTDVRMSGMTGIELLAKLKQVGVALPVIVITGHADVPMAIAALHQGVADFIEKPFSDEAILTSVKNALARAEGRDQLRAQQGQVLTRLESLSPREREVLDGLIEGHANKVIAYDLDISARTVEVYRANVMTKMQAHSLSELVRMVTIARLGGAG
jgi:two-component system response regulator FixJ